MREPQKPVVLKCRAKGSPTPEIKWFKDGLLILGTPEESRFHITIEGSLVFMGKRYHVTREGSLIIFDPRVEDEGTFTCTAENELGKVSYDVSLYVEMSEFFLIPKGSDYLTICFSHVAVLRLDENHFKVANTHGQHYKKCTARVKRGCELMRVQTLALVWPETLMHFRRLVCALIDFEPAQFFLRVVI